MSVYKDKEEMQEILNIVWEKVFKMPDIMKALSQQEMIIRFRYSDLKTELYIILENGGARVFWDPEEAPEIDVEMILSSDTSHQFWMEDLNVPLAIGTRKIIAKGSIQKALKLLPALKPAFPLYPETLKELGRADLLVTKKAGRSKKRGFSFFKRKKSTKINLDALPKFRMSQGEISRDPAAKPQSGEQTGYVDILRTMLTIREFEYHLSRAFKNGELPTEAIHLSIGQEAIATGVCLNLNHTDYLNTTHRGHGHIIAKGTDINRMMAEIYGKADGLCEGKGGSMHVTDASVGILGANGIVGAGYLLAMGAGFAIKHRKSDDISVVIAGDGSVNQGMFHEALNMIKVFNLPVLVVVENNLYGEFTHIERHSAETEIYKRMQAYNIESYQLDGNDPILVFDEMKRIIAAMREDGKPRAVELKTYRWHGHMEGEPELYRTEEEKERYIKEDPIQKMITHLKNEGSLTQDDIDQMLLDAKKEIQEAVDFALASALPKDADLFTRIYHPDDISLMKGDVPEVKSQRTMSYGQAINEAIEEEMLKDENVFLWGEDVTLGGYFNVTDGLIDKFGANRIIDTPISENGIIGGAVGAAMTGMRPICEILFSDFLTVGMDPIVNQAAKLRYMTGGQVSVPITVRTPVGSGIGMAAQHSQSMERFFLGVPGLIVVAPSDAYTAKGLLKSAIRSQNPVLLFEHKLLYASSGQVPEEEYTLPLGKARIVREGSDVTIVTHLLGVSVAMDATRILEESGIDAEVIDLMSLYPLDTETIIESVSKTGHLVTIEEGSVTGGIGAELIARIATVSSNLLRMSPLRIGADECPIPYAKNLESTLMLNPEEIADKIKNALL